MNSKINSVNNVKNISSANATLQNDPAAKKAVSDYNEFYNIYENLLQNAEESHDENKNAAIRLSQHAAKRVQERNINIDNEEFIKLQNAINKLQVKGSKDSLVITGNGAYIVDVEKKLVVTVMDKGSLIDNVFTKIDSTVIVD